MAVDEAWLNRQLEDVNRTLRELPPSVAASFAPVVANLQTTIIATIQATYSTTAQMNTAIANPGVINPSAVNTGTITCGAINASGTLRADPGIYSTDAYNFNITGTRVTGWHQNDGHIATASSSLRFKTNVVDAGLVAKAEAILGIQLHYYNYKAEIAKRDDPTSDGYVGPDYQVHLELGMIAEELHAAGLWEFVVYERDVVTATRTVTVTDAFGIESEQDVEVIVGDRLRFDADGQPIPYSIHYELFSMAVLAATQYLFGLVKAQQTQLDALSERLDKAGL